MATKVKAEMKTGAPLGLLALAVIGCASVPQAVSVRSAGHVIAAASPSGSAWTPSEGQVAQLEARLGALMAAPDRRVKFSFEREKKCPFPLSDYAVRYLGEMNAGRQIIVGKATHKEQPGAARILSSPAMRDDAVILEAFGGGSYYFTVTYDVTRDEILELRYNAPL